MQSNEMSDAELDAVVAGKGGGIAATVKRERPAFRPVQNATAAAVASMPLAAVATAPLAATAAAPAASSSKGDDCPGGVCRLRR